MELYDMNDLTMEQVPDPASGPSPAQGTDPAIAQADVNCVSADQALSDALKSLGETYFEAKKDDPDAEYAGEVAKIRQCLQHSKLCRQYRLRLEDRAMCESCGAIVTADSLFCNKCGTKMTEWDFSALNVCPSCGRSFPPGASFCEMCGYRLG